MARIIAYNVAVQAQFNWYPDSYFHSYHPEDVTLTIITRKILLDGNKMIAKPNTTVVLRESRYYYKESEAKRHVKRLKRTLPKLRRRMKPSFNRIVSELKRLIKLGKKNDKRYKKESPPWLERRKEIQRRIMDVHEWQKEAMGLFNRRLEKLMEAP